MKKLLIVIGIVVAIVAVGAIIWAVASPGKESIDTADITVSTEIFIEGDTVKAEYLVLSGIKDKKLQNKLNELLYSFYVGQWVAQDEPDPAVYKSKASFFIVGDLLNARRVLQTIGPGRSAADQRSEFSAQTLQLTDGEIFTFPLTAAQLREAVGQSIFRQAVPTEYDRELQSKLIAALEEEFIPPYYLIETGVGLYINHIGPLDNEYALFKANYADLPEIAIPGRD